MSTFLEDVAERAAVAPEVTRAILDRYSIVSQPKRGAPKALRLQHLEFTGTKRIGGIDHPVDFKWTFDTGLTVVASDRNLVGKSTVLWVIRWALTGSRPKAINKQIGSWIDDVVLRADVSGLDFTVSFSGSREPFEGRLLVAGRPPESFQSADGFEDAMAEFMLDALGLAKLPGFRKQPGRQTSGEGSAVQHGWTSHFPALHVRGDHVEMLLGDHKFHHPGVLLQVFLGIPWALTHRAADVASKVLGNRRSAANQFQKTQAETIAEQLKPLEDEIGHIDSALGTLMAAGQVIDADELERRHAAAASALAALADVDRQVSNQERAVYEARRLADNVVTLHRAERERRVLRPLLLALAPVHCPRCEESFDENRLTGEETEHVCSVCDRPLHDHGDSMAAPNLDDLARDEQDVHEALQAAQRRLASLTVQRNRAQAAVVLAKSQIPTVQATGTLDRRHRLELRRAELSGRIEQARSAVSRKASQPLDLEDRKVVEAAVAVADERRQAGAKLLLADLGREIARVANQIGMRDLEATVPDLRAHLEMTIAGHEDSFGGRTSGERLRLKIATVVALLRVGQEQGVGRHPGLLLVDSPGSDEMDPDDLRVVLQELSTLCSEIPHMQIIVATARGPIVRETVDAARTIHGPDWGPVW